MNKLQLPQAKLLYAVSELYRQRRIDQTEKRLLKEKIITDNVEIYELLEQNQSEAEIFDNLVNMISTNNAPVQPQPKNEQVQQAIQNVEQEEATSPWGEFLRHKKRAHEQKHKLQTKAIQSLINPTKAD